MIVLLAVAGAVAADPRWEENPVAPTEPPEGWLTRTYREGSGWVRSTATWLDRHLVTLLTPPRERRDPVFDAFFGNREFESTVNRSQVSIRPGLEVKEGEAIDPNLRFSARLHLPRSKNRVNLIIENFEEDENVLDEFQPSRFAQTDREAETERSIRLQAELRRTRRVRVSGTAGVSFRPEPVPKLGLRLHTQHRDEQPWVANTRSTGFWDADDGFGLRTRLNLDYLAIPNWQTQVSTSFLWSEASEGVDAGQTYSVFHRPSQRRAYAVKVAYSGKVEPYQDIDVVSLRLNSRRLLHSNWIYLEVEPGVEFPRDRDWEAVPFLNLELEFILGSLD